MLGIANADKADEIINGSFVNAWAVTSHIRLKVPKKVLVVRMGQRGHRDVGRRYPLGDP